MFAKVSIASQLYLYIIYMVYGTKHNVEYMFGTIYSYSILTYSWVNSKVLKYLLIISKRIKGDDANEQAKGEKEKLLIHKSSISKGTKELLKLHS